MLDRNRRVPNCKNRVDEETEQAVQNQAIDFSAQGRLRANNELRKKGVFVSPSGVCSIWLRNGLANFRNRLKALEKKVASEGFLLTEAQVQALKNKKHDGEACSEIETHHPG